MMQHQDLNALRTALAEIERAAAWSAERLHRTAPEVSRWSPARQIDHVLRTLTLNLRAIRSLVRGEDDRIRTEECATEAGLALLEAGRIPRGRAQAPEPTTPEELPEVESFGRRSASLGKRLEDLAALDLSASPERTLPHPLLGPFDAAQWLRFARIHTEHHLEILRDIDRDQGGG